MTTETRQHELIPTDEASAILPVDGGAQKAIRVIGTESIRETFDDGCLQQAINARKAPGVDDLVINPDAHYGYGAPVGCTMASETHIYPGPVGVDIKCSMSLLQLDLPEDQIVDKDVRRRVIKAICERVPTGASRGRRSAPESRKVDVELGKRVVTEGASKGVLESIGIPTKWAARCEGSQHVGHDDTHEALRQRLDDLLGEHLFRNFDKNIMQLGSYGGGSHFGECEVVDIKDHDRAREAAEVFGLRDGQVAFLSHCESRGFGHNLAMNQFRALEEKFKTWSTPFPANDKQLVYAPLGTPQADGYLDDMALGANFATVNHLLINALVLEAFQEVFPGVNGTLVYFISHNIARKEVVGNRPKWVMRKGATRAFPAGHFALKDTPFESTGHPILLPGDPQAGSAVMVANGGAEDALHSVNHGAGRIKGRKAAIRELDQKAINQSFDDQDILTNCRNYPKDEAPDAYKDFDEVLSSVKKAGLASEVARLRARFVIKDADKADD